MITIQRESGLYLHLDVTPKKFPMKDKSIARFDLLLLLIWESSLPFKLISTYIEFYDKDHKEIFLKFLPSRNLEFVTSM